MTKRKLSKRIIALIVCGAFLAFIAISCIALQIYFKSADKIKCWLPDYDMQNLTQILNKSELDEDDYTLLYRQTGLTKIGVDRMLEKGENGKNRILNLQKQFFTYHEVENDFFAPFVCTDFIGENITTVYLEDGDVLVTSSTHFSGWRIGHAGLVTNASTNSILQANAYGDATSIGGIKDFNDRVNYMILTPKTDKQTKEYVAKQAQENLLGKKYDIATGVFTNKNKINKTQCAHIVWYAYKTYGGIDIDGNRGPVVTPRNIANSPDMELIQVFGFDIDKLWH